MTHCRQNTFLLSLICLALPTLSFAQHDSGMPQMENVDSLYPGKAYSALGRAFVPEHGLLG